MAQGGHDGPPRRVSVLQMILLGNPCAMVSFSFYALRYMQLPSYGADKDHQKLGPNTLNELYRLTIGCK